MKINDWLASSTKQLKAAGISTSRLDCLVLLEDEIGHEKSWLLAHPEHELQIEQFKNLNTKITQRCKHEPLAYIRGKTEFYGREFIIDHRVLEPRPESETIIDLLKSLPLPNKPAITDIGTGSGMLAVTAKLELSEATVIAIDIDQDCLDVAAENAKKHQVDIQLYKGDLLEPISNVMPPLDNLILLCNLPYVPDNFHINPAAMNEPKIAIFGGPDGLNLYRKLFLQISDLKYRPAYILTESLPPQHADLLTIAETSGYQQTSEQDFIQLFELKT